MSATTQPTMFGTDPAGFMEQFLAEMARCGYVAKAGIPEKMWTLKECAAFLDVAEAKVREWIFEGLPALVENPGAKRKHFRFHPEAVSEWAKTRSLNNK